MSLRASLAIICLWRKFLAVFIELTDVVKHGDKSIWGFYFPTDDFLLCLNVYPARPPVAVLPWGNESHRVITHCKMSMCLLFIAVLKQTVCSLLLSVLEKIYTFLEPSYSQLILPPPVVAAVSVAGAGRRIAFNRSICATKQLTGCLASSPAFLQLSIFSLFFTNVGLQLMMGQFPIRAARSTRTS